MPVANIVMGPPIFAPLLFGVSGYRPTHIVPSTGIRGRLNIDPITAIDSHVRRKARVVGDATLSASAAMAIPRRGLEYFTTGRQTAK
jgi:hypothetical protein